jgi:hypothetical protein
MEFEAGEPPHRRLAAARVDAKDPMLLDARWVADGQRGGVDEADARARSPQCVQVDGERHEEAWHELDKAAVAQGMWKFLAQGELDVLEVEPFESAIA